MPRAARAVPRLVNDTYRTLIGLALLMAVSVVLGVAYGLGTAALDLPLPRTATYLATSSLLSFVIYFVIYQLLTWGVLHRADAGQLSEWARQTTPRSVQQRRLERWTGSGARAWALTAAGFALITVLAVLLVPELRTNAAILVLSLLAVTTGWSMLVHAYAVAYLRLHADTGGLVFPEDAGPVWSDYVYLAVQVSATFSSSDVDVTSTPMRRLVTGHTLLAFVFNTVVVALLVSVLVTLAD